MPHEATVSRACRLRPVRAARIAQFVAARAQRLRDWIGKSTGELRPNPLFAQEVRGCERLQLPDGGADHGLQRGQAVRIPGASHEPGRVMILAG
jgi:hypothetical protein